MKLHSSCFGISGFLAAVSLFALKTAALPSHSRGRPAYLVLAGDSTTAGQSAGGGGWGDGFLNTTLRYPASGRNFGHNGATTVSFVQGGDWAAVLEDVASHVDSHKVFVTIQFGHNDQKAAKNISLSEYSANLGQLVRDVRSAQGTPILVTPLTRRQFSGTPPLIVENLASERNATIAVAKSLGARWIDLNGASEAYCNEIGPEASWAYNLAEDDKTHLNHWGSVVFGRIVSDLLVEKYRDIAAWSKPNATLTEEIKQGIPA